jgi:uncharacterized protein (DUF302 family)
LVKHSLQGIVSSCFSPDKKGKRGLREVKPDITNLEERQALSIEAQIEEVREYARKEGLTILAEFTDSQTAKEPGRPKVPYLLV